MNPERTRLFDNALPNEESRLRAVFDQLAAHGGVLVVVDQPNTIGALPVTVTVARACGHDVAYLPGLSMRRIADLYPGRAKTDARDAFIIADTALTMPHTVRRVDTGQETLSELGVLVGWDDDLTGEATRLSNRIRGLLTGIHPALERVLGPRVTHPAVLEILSRCGGPAGIGTTGTRRLTTITAKRAPRLGARLVTDTLTALGEQSVVVPGTDAAEIVLSKLANSLKEVLAQRNDMALEVERILDAHPLSPVLTSMPGVGARTAARILLEVGDGSTFASAGHLASYAGITPVTRRSGSPIRGEHPALTGNRNSSEHCSCPRSPPCTTPPAAPTTIANTPKAKSTTQPSSASPAAAATSSTPCSRTKSATGHRHLSPLDENHRDTPRVQAPCPLAASAAPARLRLGGSRAATASPPPTAVRVNTPTRTRCPQVGIGSPRNVKSNVAHHRHPDCGASREFRGSGRAAVSPTVSLALDHL